MSSNHEERKHFMQGKQQALLIGQVEIADPLRKREEFAVSLRKQKTKEIIREKRRKIMESLYKQPQAGYPLEPWFYHGWFNHKSMDPNDFQGRAHYEQVLLETAPQLRDAHDIVSDHASHNNVGKPNQLCGRPLGARQQPQQPPNARPDNLRAYSAYLR